MYRNGHYGAALLASSPVSAGLVVVELIDLAVVIAAGTVWLAMLPDIDHRLPGIAHRGPTHTVWFALLVAAVLGGVGVLVSWSGVGAPHDTTTLVLAGAAVGVLSVGSHLLADVITPSGLRPFWPLSNRWYSLDIVSAKSRVGNYGLLGAGVFVTVAWVALVVRFLPR